MSIAANISEASKAVVTALNTGADLSRCPMTSRNGRWIWECFQLELDVAPQLVSRLPDSFTLIGPWKAYELDPSLGSREVQLTK